MSRSNHTDFIVKAFRDYYRRKKMIISVDDIARREIMLMHFNGKVVRYLSFHSQEELRNRLVNDVPAHAYYSASKYEKPERMEGWLGMELLFDIDADKLHLPCKYQHDYWVCERCGMKGRGSAPINCPECGSDKLKTVTWICNSCLEAARKETIKLIEEFLLGDFCFHKQEIRTVFTGNRGFHVIVSDSKILDLSEDQRKSIVEYVSGSRLSAELIVRVVQDKKKKFIVLPSVRESGWRGRYARHVESILESLARIRDNPELMAEIKRSLTDGRPFKVDRKSRVDKLLRDLVGEVRKRYGCKVDKVVTPDLKRSSRIPNTLHGKTGWRVYPLTVDELYTFNPSLPAASLGDIPVRVRSLGIPELPPSPINPPSVPSGEVFKLPLYMAVTLLLKGMVEPVQQ